MKRIIGLLLCLALLCAALPALGEEDSILTFSQPEDVEVYEAADLPYYPAPEGLEPMYALMANANAISSAYVFVMPNGRVLMSLASTLRQPDTAQSLLDAWPAIALGLSGEAESVNTDASCASLGSCFGYQGLKVRTRMELSAPLAVEADGMAFYRASDLVEMWTVRPESALYANDPYAAAELQSDLATLDTLKRSMNLGQALPPLDEALLESATDYASPDGAFSLKLPASAAVLTAQSAPADVERQRQAYAALGAGGERVFGEWMKDVNDESALLVLLPEYGLALELFCQEAPQFQGKGLGVLDRVAASVENSLAERYGQAELLEPNGRKQLAGTEHCWQTYGLTAEGLTVTLELYAAKDQRDWLREADVFVFAVEDAQGQANAMQLLLQTLEYRDGQTV